MAVPISSAGSRHSVISSSGLEDAVGSVAAGSRGWSLGTARVCLVLLKFVAACCVRTKLLAGFFDEVRNGFVQSRGDGANVREHVTALAPDRIRVDAKRPQPRLCFFAHAL